MEAPVEGAVMVEGVNVLSCFNCSLNLTGHRYILRDDKPFCIQCYESLFANKCEECKQPIGTDFKVNSAIQSQRSVCQRIGSRRRGDLGRIACIA